MQGEKDQEWIVVRGMGSVSGMGCSRTEVTKRYALGTPSFASYPYRGSDLPVSPISNSGKVLLQTLLNQYPTYATLDRSVQLAILAARQAVQEAGWLPDGGEPIGINIGSSRGATGLFEKFHADFLQNPDQRLSPGASPSTTLGNVASWVAHDLQTQGPLISHSVTCSTALQAFANGVAWLKSGMAKRFLVGGTEAPLTPFTLAQMKALGIYSPYAADDTPCRPLNPEKQNTFVLAEGTAVFALERMSTAELLHAGTSESIVVLAVGLGYEKSPSKTGLTPDGGHFRTAMLQALSQANLSPTEIDGLVLHAPGTKAGDAAEMSAIESAFKERMPSLFSNKNLIGHTLGASGALSAELAILLLSGLSLTQNFYKNNFTQANYKSVLINAAGFGGNAACLALGKCKLS